MSERLKKLLEKREQLNAEIQKARARETAKNPKRFDIVQTLQQEFYEKFY